MIEQTPIVAHPQETFDWLTAGLLYFLGGIGAVIRAGVEYEPEKPFSWVKFGTTVLAGCFFAGTGSNVAINYLKLDSFWTGIVALSLGILAIGFVQQAVQGKIPFINRIMGVKTDAN